MAVLARLNGEVAGLSGSDLELEGLQSGYTVDLLPAGTFAAYSPREAANGLSGNYFFGCDDATSSRSADWTLSTPSRELWVFCPIKRASFGNATVFMEFRASGATAAGQDHAEVVLQTDGRILLRTDNVDRITSVGSLAVDDATFHGIWVYLLVDNTNGIFRVYDSDPAGSPTPFVEWTGDTYENTGTFAQAISFLSIGFSPGCAGDDWKVQSPSVLFTSASGPVSTGATLSFYDGGATLLGTAIAEVFEGTAGASSTDGRIHLSEVRDSGGTLWDGVRANDPLIGWASVDNSGSWSASPQTGYESLEPSSGFPLDVYQVAVEPDGNGAVIQLTSSTANPNWQNVDDGLDSASADSAYNDTSTIGNADRYTFGALPSSSLVSAVDGIAVLLRVQETGSSSIGHVAALAYTSAEVESVQQAIPSGAFTVQRFEFALDPLGAAWTHSNADGGEFGLRMKA